MLPEAVQSASVRFHERTEGLALNVSEGLSEYQIRSVTGDCPFILSPQEGPVVVILEVVRLTEQESWSDIARDKREVRSVVSVEHLFGMGRSDRSHERVVVVRVTTEQPGRRFVDVLFPDDVREVPIGIAESCAEGHDLAASGPVTRSYRDSVRVVLLKAQDIFEVFFDEGTQFLLVGSVKIWNSVQGRVDGERGELLQGWPDGLRELVQVGGFFR